MNPTLAKGMKIPLSSGENTADMLKSEQVNLLKQAIMAALNLEVVIRQQDSAGNSANPIYADVRVSNGKLIVVIDPVQSVPNAGTGGTSGTYGGNGPPSAATLGAPNIPTGTQFTAGANPSIYIDETNDASYFCSVAGTASSSQWTKITAQWNFRGLWSPTPNVPYTTFDVVQMGSGTAAGIYMCVAQGNTSSPFTGTGWIQISSSSGVWL